MRSKSNGARSGTRREAAEHFEPLLKPVAHLVADHAGVWSWLGLFYFAETVRRQNGVVQLSPLDETFVVDRRDGASRSYQLRFRHYLWGSWRLYEQHGESAAFLLDRELAQWGDIEQRSFGAIRIFNSVGGRAVDPAPVHAWRAPEAWLHP